MRLVYRIGKAFTFEAAHHLDGLPAGHKCSRPHGHSYTVQVTVIAEKLSGPGFVTDFGELSPLRDYVARTLDHQDLNQALGIEPTSENLARHLFEWCQGEIDLPAGASVESVRISETAATWAEYRAGAAS